MIEDEVLASGNEFYDTLKLRLSSKALVLPLNLSTNSEVVES